MIDPNPRLPAARAYLEELEQKRERIRMSGGEFTTIGVPLTAEERAWMLVYLKAEKVMRETGTTRRRSLWRRRGA